MVSGLTFAKAAALGAVLAVTAAQVPIAAQDVGSPFHFEQFTTLSGGSQVGISIRDLGADDVSREGLEGLAGAYVEDVREGSPADEAGLRAGDILTSFDGERVRSAAQLARLVRETPGGRSVEVAIQRERSPLTLTITPEEGRPAVFGRAEGRGITSPRVAARIMPRVEDHLVELMPIPGLTPRLGVQVQNVGEQLGAYFGAERGVLVTNVDDDSPAASAGLRAGDVITSVDGEDVTDVAGLRRALTGADGAVQLDIVRDRASQTLTATLPDRSERRPAAVRSMAIGL